MDKAADTKTQVSTHSAPKTATPVGNMLEVQPLIQPENLTDKQIIYLQRMLGNRAVQRMLKKPISIQRAYLDSKADWVAKSDIGSLNPRSKRLKDIDAAVELYVIAPDRSAKLNALVALLDAISKWRVSKGADAETGKGDGADDAKRAPFVEALLEEVTEQVEKMIDANRDAWDPDGGNFSDPTKHDPAKFQYLINAIVDYEAEGNPVPKYINDILDDPSKIKNALVSSSLITETQNPTWATSGFILRAPKENIYAAKSSDQGLKNKAAGWHDVELYKELLRVYQANGLPTPAAVMQGMKKSPLTGKANEQNEVAVMGMNPQTGEETTVTGIFIVVAANTSDPLNPIPLYKVERTEMVDGKPKQYVTRVPGVSAKRMQKYQEIAAQQKIPMVAIPLGAQTTFRAQPGRPVPWNADTMILLDK